MEIENYSCDISIITPFYKGNNYISKLAKCIVDNKKNCSLQLEWIIVNDSPDEEINLYNDFNFDINIIVNQHNVGIHRSRVKGIKCAKGKYILMIDQDDILEKDALKTLYSNINDADIIVGNGYEESSTKNGPIYHSKKHQQIVKDEKWYYTIGCAITSPGHCLIKKASIPDLWKVTFMEKNGADDLLLWLIMLNEGKQFTTVYKNVYKHIFTDKNVSNDFMAMKESCNEVISILEENNLIDIKMKKLFLRRLKMRESYEGKPKIRKYLAYLRYIDITYSLFRLKRM